MLKELLHFLLPCRASSCWLRSSLLMVQRGLPAKKDFLHLQHTSQISSVFIAPEGCLKEPPLIDWWSSDALHVRCLLANHHSHPMYRSQCIGTREVVINGTVVLENWGTGAYISLSNFKKIQLPYFVLKPADGKGDLQIPETCWRIALISP